MNEVGFRVTGFNIITQGGLRMRRIHGVILLLCLLCSMLLIGCQNKVNNEPSTSPADVNELDPEITTSMAPGPDDDYRNPVLNGYADPDVLLYEGVYYLYATGAEGYLVHTSTDLKEWEVTARAVYPDLWGIQTNYWAPDVEYINGKFYMVVTCEEKLGMAVSDSPLGPFEEAHDSVMYEHSLDGHLFVDDDGSIYLYFSSWRPGLPHGIYGVLLNDDMRPIPETETLLLVPEEDWEKYGYGVVEGPFILKREGIYYLTYSGSDYRSPNYAVGYATSESPLGTYERYE